MSSRLERKILIVNDDLGPQEVKEIMSNPKAFQAIVEEKTFGKGSLKLGNMVKDIKEKYDDILTLESVLIFSTRMLDKLT